MREVNVEKFAAAHAKGATVVDVRQPLEYILGHVPGARLMPLGKVAAQGRDLPRGQRVYVICATGSRSTAAARQLSQLGIDAVSVSGGTGAWRAAGHPVVRGRKPSK